MGQAFDDMRQYIYALEMEKRLTKKQASSLIDKHMESVTEAWGAGIEQGMEHAIEEAAKLVKKRKRNG